MLARLRFLTAGESHGPALVGILEGMPAGVPVDREALQQDMARRRAGAGRSARMQIEADVVEIKAGLRHGRTLGSPLAFVIENRDHHASDKKWRDAMSIWPLVARDASSENDGARGSAIASAEITVPRPGHADLAGMQKLGTGDARDVLERASARETAARTAVGALCRQLLRACGIEVESRVTSVGARAIPMSAGADEIDALMLAEIERARAAGDTLGGSLVVLATGLPVGLGHFTHWDRRLTARLAEAVASIHAVRGVSFGDAVERVPDGGRAFHDPIESKDGARASNRAGGVEGGMSNGMPLVVHAIVKPLSTVPGGLPSVDTATGARAQGHVERSDTCVVPSAAVVAEAMVCVVLADALLEKFGGDSLDQLKAHMAASAVHTAQAAAHGRTGSRGER